MDGLQIVAHPRYFLPEFFILFFQGLKFLPEECKGATFFFILYPDSQCGSCCLKELPSP